MKRILISAAVNSNKEYLFYVPFFIDSWINQKHPHFEFIPKVICVNFTPEISAEYLQYCKPFYIESTLSDITLAQLSRYMIIPDEIFDFLIPTDIDMIPISNLPFSKAIEFITSEENQFVVMRNVLPSGQFPICYNIASPYVWSELLINYFQSSDFSKIVKGLEVDFGQVSDWYLDQRLLFQMLSSQNIAEVILLNDSHTNLRRLDRNRHSFPFNWFILVSGFIDRFTEYHSARSSLESWLFLKILTSRNRRNK